MVAGLVTDPVAATVTAAVDDEPQVSVGVIYRPVVSKTSAVRGCVPPVLKVKEVSELVALRTAMLATGQVRYDAPTLFTPETLAKTVVAPDVRRPAAGGCAIAQGGRSGWCSSPRSRRRDGQMGSAGNRIPTRQSHSCRGASHAVETS